MYFTAVQLIKKSLLASDLTFVLWPTPSNELIGSDTNQYTCINRLWENEYINVIFLLLDGRSSEVCGGTRRR